MYRLIACDLDETLLDDNGDVPPRVRDAVTAARKRGARFVLATGRPYVSTHRTLDQLGILDAEDEYVISFNGGVITENADERPLTSCELDPDVAEALYERGVAQGLCMHVYTLDTVYVYNYLPEERTYIEGRMCILETDEPTLSFLRDKGEPIVKLLYMSFDARLLHALEHELADIGVTQGLDVCYSSNRYLEFNAPGVNKGAGLLELARRLGIPQSETMAIGDNSNDVPMIRAAGLGVAVANATDEAKASAGYVCHAGNNAGAVAEALERFVLGD
ncbi:MAG TPA: Cof-type HAD-IIB family hydrolase [Candidatus Olsenella excrementavium]|uniref:Cof-type HAD-IIB family hydrolase n=1 Tax=Candidatus Olsenella excrementavium TaxID=2838709 RepID=A0A9D1ZA38_9ACTN|nr:Cof-type HAD-IIB family hydrolase [Candidatus Olsenella excrementavium]